MQQQQTANPLFMPSLRMSIQEEKAQDSERGCVASVLPCQRVVWLERAI